MEARVLTFYNEIFSDLTIDREEAAELTDFLQTLNPPPDTLPKLRACAFRSASAFLTDDNRDQNVQLIKTLNCIVHAIEANCLVPKEDLENTVPYDEDTITAFYTSMFDDLSVDQEENAELFAFFQETNVPEMEGLVSTRALAFKVGCQFLGDDQDTNTQLLRCINVIVHAFETSCFTPKPFVLPPTPDLSMGLSDAVQHLWNLDANRLTPGDDYVMDVQSGKKPYWKEDSAADPLFTSVDKHVWQRPTYAAFIKLLDNYSAETGTAEKITSTERSEVKSFLHNIMESGPMQFCHEYCHANNPDKCPSDRSEFIALLQSIWFEMYRRQGRNLDSSGFEHVFVGEIKNGDVSGFHNWIQFYLEEKKGTIDYRGYIKPRGQGAHHDGNDYLLTLQFAWEGVEKFVGTSFIGVSPEFEMALYTMCFLVGEQENEVDIQTETDVYGVKIKCYTMDGNKIGTAFPEVTSHYEDE